MTNYSWSVSSGGTIASGGTSTDNTVSINWITAGAQTLSVNYTDGNGCTAESPTIHNVTVHPRPNPSLSGSATACVGSTGNVYTTDAGMTNYLWYIPGGASITAGGGSTDNTVTITWLSSGYKPIGVNYANSYGCIDTSATTLQVIVNDIPTALVLTGSTICESPGNNGTITSSTSATSVKYQLYNSGNIAVQSPQTGTGSGLTWSSLAAGTGYYVTGTDTTTNCTSPSNAVNVDTYPNSIPIITGPASVCVNSTNNIYTTETGKTGYSWTVSAGGTISSGGSGTDNTVTITWNTAGAQNSKR